MTIKEIIMTVEVKKVSYNTNLHNLEYAENEVNL